MTNLSEVWRRATVAELAWVDAAGATGIPVVPLVRDGRPCVALPYSRYDDVAYLDQQVVTFSITDIVDNAPAAASASGRVEVLWDTDGVEFLGELLPQEIVKYPPTRLRADGLMAQRDNWWWVGRILITLTDVHHERGLPGRTRPADAVLVRARHGRADVEVVTAHDWPAETGSVPVFGRDGTLLEGQGEEVFVFGHDRSQDAERWERWHRRGHLIGEDLQITESEGSPSGPLKPWSLRQRYRNERAIARECKRGIAAAERNRPRG